MKRVLSLLLVVAMLVAMVPFNTHVHAAEQAYLEVSSAEGLPGEQVDVTVSLKNNPGFGCMELKVYFDDSVLKLVNYELDLGSDDCTGSKLAKVTNSLKLLYVTDVDADGGINIEGDGVLVTMTFEIIGTTPCTADVYTVVEEGTTFYYDGYDENEFDLEDGSGVVTVLCAHESKTEVPAKSADCENTGNNLYFVCESCGRAFKADGVTETTVENETIAALGHNWVDADCDTPKTCDRCGETEGEALGHDWIDADCDTPKTCSVCGETEGEALGHDWIDADCDTPKTCSVCGETEGEALGHKWVDADCDTPKTCSVCGETEGEALGHKWVDADCDTPKTCDRCGETEGEALGHAYSTEWSKGEEGHWHECVRCSDKADFAEHDFGTEGDECVICEYERSHVHRLTLVPAVAPTCTENGNEAYYTCSGCENWFEDASGTVLIVDKTSVVIAALDHDLTAPTCTEDAACQRENCGYVAEGTALGHSFTNYISNDDATCTEDGTKTAKCDRCDETDTMTDVGSAYGHDWVDADCDTPKTCERCGETEGEALGHDWIDADCDTPKTCSVCGETEGEALGHDWIDADCDTPKTCDRCGKTEGEALGHDWIDADCDTPKTCSVCGETEGEALGHAWVDADCDTPKTCERCGETEGEALGHEYATEWSKGEEGHWHECVRCSDKADFAEHNFGDEGDSCVICGYERNHAHRLTLVPAVAPTCTETGNEAYYTCSGCENWFEDASGTVLIADKTSVVIAALDHDLSDPACTEDAACQRENCGYVAEGTALGHSFTDYISNDDATCTEDGTKTAKCDRCDETDTLTDVGSVKGHAWVEADCDTPKTCDRCGETEGEALGHNWVDADCDTPKTCDRCGETEGEALGHEYASEWSKGEEGHWHECVRCSDKADFAEHDFGTEGDKCVICEYERSHVHRLTLVPAVGATCTEGGNKAYYTCSGCESWFEDAAGTILIEDKTSVNLAPLGHDIAEATCTQDAYCQREGCDYVEDGTALGHAWVDADCEHPKTCERCSETDGEALGHAYENGVCTVCGDKEENEEPTRPSLKDWFKKFFGSWWGDDEDKCDHEYSSEVKDPTCTNKGYTKHTCVNCGDSYIDSYVAATGHNYEDGVCTGCGKKKPAFGFWFDWFWKK